MKIKATAKILVTLEVEETGWGGDCSIDQLYKQAARDAVTKVRNIIEMAGKTHRARIVGEPKVIGVITEQE